MEKVVGIDKSEVTALSQVRSEMLVEQASEVESVQMEDIIPENETPLQKRIRENRHLTDSLLKKQAKKKEDSLRVMEEKRAVVEPEPDPIIHHDAIRVAYVVDPEDRKPNIFGTGSAEDKVMNEDPLEKFERRTDFDLVKKGPYLGPKKRG